MASSDVHTVCTDTDLVGRDVSAVSEHANFSGSNLATSFFPSNAGRSANFNNATLIGAIFNQATPVGATFVGADLSGSVFQEGSDASNADFSGANLTGARFGNVNLTGATFEGADLTGVIWVPTYGSSTPTCPDGTLASAHGDTCIGHLTPAAS